MSKPFYVIIINKFNDVINEINNIINNIYHSQIDTK